MAAITWFGTAVESNNWLELNETSPGADTTSATGWTVGTGATNHSEMESGVKRAASTFTGTGPPDGTLDSTLGDAFRTAVPYTGDFANANWTFQFTVIGVQNAGAQDGRIRFRLFRGANADGTGATEITAAQQQGGLVTNLSTTQAHSSLTFNPGAITLNNEYLFVQVAWERTGAGGMAATDVLMRFGSTATQITSANFTPPAAPDWFHPEMAQYVAESAIWWG